MSKRIAVVGAGISGLAVARALRAKGHIVSIFESAPRIGGAVRSERHGEFLLESGPTSFLGDGPMSTLAQDLGIASQLVTASPRGKRRYVVWQGRMMEVPSSPGALLRTPLLSWWGKLRLLCEPLIRSRTSAAETVSGFFRRRFGAAVANLADVFVAGIYAGDAARISFQAAFPRLAEIEREYGSILLGARRAKPGALQSFQGGLQTVTDALGKHLEGSVHAGTAVTALARAGEKWILRVASADHAADTVVLAIPSFAAAGLVASLRPELASVLATIEHAPIVVAHLAWPSSACERWPEGFGCLVHPGEGSRVLGVLFVSNIFPDRSPADSVLLSVMMGGVRHPEICGLSDSSLLESARADLGRWLGVRGEPALARLVRHPRVLPQYEVGHLERVALIEEAERSYPGLYFAGHSYRGVGLSECARDAELLAARIHASP